VGRVDLVSQEPLGLGGRPTRPTRVQGLESGYQGLARRDRKGSLNDGRIQNPSNPFGIVPLSNFVPRGFGLVHHSIAILYHQVPNPNLTIRTFFIAVPRLAREMPKQSRPRTSQKQNFMYPGSFNA
jgi:hypothetical protein